MVRGGAARGDVEVAHREVRRPFLPADGDADPNAGHPRIFRLDLVNTSYLHNLLLKLFSASRPPLPRSGLSTGRRGGSGSGLSLSLPHDTMYEFREEDGNMVVGVPKETTRHEHRVGLNPFGIARLTDCGHEVYVERGAGKAAHFSDEDYTDAGARIVYDAEEIYKRADLVCRFGALTPEEIPLLREDSVICSFHHLAVAPREIVQALMERKATLIGYEIIRGTDGDLPALLPLSELAGQMAVDTAAGLLRFEAGGRGILLGSAPGLPPATVVILGAGAVGTAAARHAVVRGAHVILIDTDIHKLRRAGRELGNQVITAVGGMARLERYKAIADVLIGAVLIPGARSPLLVTEGMVRAMKPGSVIIDV
ncbi:MAG: hypothetical protein EHM19_04580, partial [Candidatus Latescibacterota bacterium]